MSDFLKVFFFYARVDTVKVILLSQWCLEYINIWHFKTIDVMDQYGIWSLHKDKTNDISL